MTVKVAINNLPVIKYFHDKSITYEERYVIGDTISFIEGQQKTADKILNDLGGCWTIRYCIIISLYNYGLIDSTRKC